MVSERRLVLDANILMRAVLGRRVRQIIETHSEHASFFAPDEAIADARRHLPDVVRKRGGDDAAVAAAIDLLDAVARNVDEIEAEAYEPIAPPRSRASTSATPTTGRSSPPRWLWTARCGPRTTTSSAPASQPGRATASSSTWRPTSRRSMWPRAWEKRGSRIIRGRQQPTSTITFQQVSRTVPATTVNTR